MQTPSREEEQRGGFGRPQGEVGASEALRPGAAPEEPGLIVYVVIANYGRARGTEILGVRSTIDLSRQLCEQRWWDQDPTRLLLWDDSGPYILRKGRRIAVAFSILPHAVV